MQENDTLTAPPVEGSSEGTESQVTESVSQETTQPQETGPVKVDNQPQVASNQPPERPLASDRFRERERNRRIETELRQLKEYVTKLGSNQPQPQPSSGAPSTIDVAALYADPAAFLKSFREDIQKEIRKEILETQLPEMLKQREQQHAYKTAEQEALEMLFPKDSSKPNETLEQRVKANSDRAQRLQDIITEHKLDVLSQSDPKAAANLALMIYNTEAQARTKVNPAAPKKSQMVSTVTGTPVGGAGGLKKMTLSEIKAKQAELDKRLDAEPSLRYDANFVKERNDIKGLLLTRAKELANTQG